LPAPNEVAATPAPAAADLAAAKRHYAEGEKKFKAADYAGAVVDFRAANDVKATPQAERYVALCEDALGHYAIAVEWYEKFLAHVPEKLAAQGDEVRKRVGEIKSLPGKMHVESTPPGADVSIDDKPQPAPAPFDVELPPGTHTVRLSATGRVPVEKSVELSFASSQTVSAELPLQPPPSPASPPPVAAVPAAPPPPPSAAPETHSQIPAYVTGAIAVAAAGVGTAFGIVALNDKASFDRNPTTSTADNGDTHSLIADMAFGVAVTFGATAAVLFFTRDDTQPSTASSRPASEGTAGVKRTDGKRSHAVSVVPTPIVGPHSGGAGVLVQF
jgi:hypothetical protein